MAQPTNIEWTEQSWNFLRGCRRVSTGCGCDTGGGCYAERQAIRHVNITRTNAATGERETVPGPYHGLVRSTPKGPRWTGKISFHEDILLAPLKRRTPTKYFVNSMSDLFYEDVTDEMLDKAFAVMALCPQHTFQLLTKRPERMKAYFDYYHVSRDHNRADFVADQAAILIGRPGAKGGDRYDGDGPGWPLPNVWLGVSVENQEYADKRIPLLLETPAAVRWISAEPLLGPIDLGHIKFPNEQGNEEDWNVIERIVMPNGMDDPTLIGVDDPILDWVVVGGESGPRSRPCDIAWIRSIVEQCKSAGVSVFVKQLGAKPRMCNANEWDWPDSTLLVESGDDGFAASTAVLNNRKGGKPDEWPEGLRIREMPKVCPDIVL